MSAGLVDYRVEHGVAISELHNPPANTYTCEMMRSLDECMRLACFQAGNGLVQLGKNISPVARTVSHRKTRAFPSPNWRGNCGTQY